MSFGNPGEIKKYEDETKKDEEIRKLKEEIKRSEEKNKRLENEIKEIFLLLGCRHDFLDIYRNLKYVIKRLKQKGGRNGKINNIKM